MNEKSSTESSRQIAFADAFDKDWQHIFKDNATSKKYLKKFAQLYENLLDYGHEECRRMYPKKYDILEGSHIALLKLDFQNKPINLRVIYFYDRNRKTYIFLHCFQKKNDSDYKLAIKKSENRLQTVLEGR